jgi:hypothetical protein
MAGEITAGGEDPETGYLLQSSSDLSESSLYHLPVQELYKKLHTSMETGLQYNHAERQQARSEQGANIIPPPVDCPMWLCCLLPCLLKTKKMKYFKSLQVIMVEAVLDGKMVRIDPTGLLVGDVIRISAGMHLPADIKLVKIEEGPCLFDTRAITGEGATFAEREGICITSDGSGGDSDSGGDSVLHGSHHYSSNYFGHALDPVNNLNIACAGFLCTQGECLGVVIATGAETMLAKMIKRKEWPPT